MLGTDPEFFILDQNDKPVPAWTIFANKHSAEEVKGRGKFFRDGYALEINTKPAYCRTQMAIDVWSVLQSAMKRLPAGHRLVTRATVKIDSSDVATAPEDCQIFGCDPSWSAYSDEPIRPELNASTHPYRYAGGHMHISGLPPTVDLTTDEGRKFLVKAYDLFVGLPLAYIFDDEENRLRRQYYGQAGEYRFQEYPPTHEEIQRAFYNKLPKPLPTHGIEYRVPPPQVWNSHKISNLFFGVLRSVPLSLQEIKEVWKPSWEDDIREQINNCDVSYHWLQKVVGHYTPALLKKVKEAKEFQEFTLKTEGNYPLEDDGFVEWTMLRFPKHFRRLLGHELHTSANQVKYGDYLATAHIRQGLLKAA